MQRQRPVDGAQVTRLIPSLVIDKESIDRAVDILDRAMTMAEARSGITA